MDGGFAAAELPAATGCVITMTLVVPHAARSGEIASDVATTQTRRVANRDDCLNIYRA